MLTNLIKQQIKEHSLKFPNEETCGLIASSGDSFLYYPCKNISSNKKNHFEISPFDYLRISENNKIIGIVHSQYSDVPSALDVINKMGHNLLSFIYSKNNDSFIEVKEEHLKYGEYIGLSFEMGKNDCLTLVQKFYEKEYGIKMNNYYRDSNWFNRNPDIIKENYKKEGFTEHNNLSQIKQGDVVLCKDRHFGIYLNNDLFLHHRKDCFSNVEQFDGKWKTLADKFYRHKNNE